MSLVTQLSRELKQLSGFSSEDPQIVSVSESNGIDLEIHVTAVDSMSCEFRKIRLHVPSLTTADIDLLKEWADSFCSRITYLLEDIGPLELDPKSGQVLIRSTPPDRRDDSTSFYEILLESEGSGHFSLRRYRSELGGSGRRQVGMQTTLEIVERLVGDLIDTIPATKT